MIRTAVAHPRERGGVSEAEPIAAGQEVEGGEALGRGSGRIEHATSQERFQLRGGDRWSIISGVGSGTRHRRGVGDEGQKPAGDAVPVLAPGRRSRPNHPKGGPGHRGVREASLLLEPEEHVAGNVRREMRIQVASSEERVSGSKVGEHPLDRVGNEDNIEVEPLGLMQGGDGDRVGRLGSVAEEGSGLERVVRHQRPVVVERRVRVPFAEAFDHLKQTHPGHSFL